MTLPSIEEHTEASAVYLEALGFTKPLEKIVFCGVPLQSLLEWLSKPKGPNLVEAAAAMAPEKALVLATTPRMLYGSEPLYVGVGLVYKPHYISMESFSTAYMHLHVWHAAGSSEDSPDRLESSCFIMVNVSEMSDVAPVAMPHPVFLDVEAKETMKKTGKPLDPLWFRGFRLHTMWSRPLGVEPVHQVTFPRLRGDATSPMLEYEPEKFPQDLLQGPKMSIRLWPPSSEHWNIESDLILTLIIETYKHRPETKRAEQDSERESAGAEASPKETSVPQKAPQAAAGDSRAVSPTETTHQGERHLKTALGIVEHIHALRLQLLHEMGGVRELELAAVRTLMAEFARLQSIVCEELMKSLAALHSELESSSEALAADILNVLNLRPGDLAFSRVRELVQKHHQSVSMKVHLPLMELEAAKEDLERFLQACLHELGSDPKAQEVVKEISQVLSVTPTKYERLSSFQESNNQRYSIELCWRYPWTSL